MTRQRANFKFLTAVFNWLLVFPHSPLQKKDSFEDLSSPQVVLNVLKVLLDGDFDVELDSRAALNLDAYLDVYTSSISHFDSIFKGVLNYYDSKTRPKKKLLPLLELLDSSRLADGDYSQLTVLSFILFEIGLHGSQSSISIAIISDLSHEDQSQLHGFMRDKQNLNIENLRVNHEISLLETENIGLKEKLKAESVRCKMVSGDLVRLEERYKDLQKVCEGKDQLAQVLEDVNKGFTREINTLKFELSQANRDLQVVTEGIRPRSKSIPTKLKVPKSDPEKLEYTEWEANLLKELIRYRYKSRY